MHADWLTESQPGATGAAPMFKDTLYDAQGRVASVTNRNGNREDEIYKTDGQLVRKLFCLKFRGRAAEW